ncbi:hypothetical protein [Methanofollis fontis]|uniref:Uncharacterized protein n=1 Tax=Methanofollis fontis TaxID=2052832 RepID=A0A483CSV8_9EURY|nr:hypothetical protein [Methanofollis fontis]TAJ45424.1 hypothetical protein CUJ86_01430 [Methanofollis fontis]
MGHRNATLKGDLWYQSWDNRSIAIDAPRGYLQAGDEREIFYEFDIHDFDPVSNDWSPHVVHTELWVNGKKVKRGGMNYSTGAFPANVGMYKVKFPEAGHYDIEIRGGNKTLSVSVDVRPAQLQAHPR